VCKIISQLYRCLTRSFSPSEIAPASPNRRRIEPKESKLFLDDTMYARIDMAESSLLSLSTKNRYSLRLEECALVDSHTREVRFLVKNGCALYPIVQILHQTESMAVELKVTDARCRGDDKSIFENRDLQCKPVFCEEPCYEENCDQIETEQLIASVDPIC